MTSAPRPIVQPQSPSACQHVWVADKNRAGRYLVACMKCQLEKDVEVRAPDGSDRPNRPAGFQRRLAGAGLAELKVDAGDGNTFEGYGCVYGPMDSYRCIWEQGVFAASLSAWRSRGEWPSFYLQHDWDILVGNYTDMYEDSKGLVVKGRFLQGSPWGDHARALVKTDTATDLSVGFVAIDERLENEDDWTKVVRHITKADLYEVSLVERGAVPGAGVTDLRADMSAVEVRAAFQELGFSAEVIDRLAARARPSTDEEAARVAAELQARSTQGMVRELREAAINQTLIRDLQNAGAHLHRK